MPGPPTKFGLLVRLDPRRARALLVEQYQKHGTWLAVAERLEASERQLYRWLDTLELDAETARETRVRRRPSKSVEQELRSSAREAAESVG